MTPPEDTIPETKFCRGCRRNLLLTDYFRLHRGKYGRKARCKACERGDRPCPDCGEIKSGQGERCRTCAQKEQWVVRRGATVPPNPSGLCQCGCGEKTPIAQSTHRKIHQVEGHHVRFCFGHKSAQAGKQTHIVDPVSGCWIWQGSKYRGGYGGTKHGPAHRVYHEQKHGPIPAGLHLHHVCRNPSCVNPDHTVRMTPSDHSKLTNQLRRQKPAS